MCLLLTLNKLTDHKDYKVNTKDDIEASFKMSFPLELESPEGAADLLPPGAAAGAGAPDQRRQEGGGGRPGRQPRPGRQRPAAAADHQGHPVRELCGLLPAEGNRVQKLKFHRVYKHSQRERV